MQTVSFIVKPNIPERLKPLEEMANNLWLSWNFDAVQLFMRLDYDVWLTSRQNPARTLGRVSQARLEEIAQDSSFLAAMDAVYEKYQKYLQRERWHKEDGRDVIAYFSMEYGLDVSLPIYSGGLGVLSGDHLKTASDLGLPLVGIGLLYRQGYFQQYLNPDGFQQEFYPENDWYTMPVQVCRNEQGEALKITVDLGSDIVCAQVWEVRVGKTPLYLLDSNIEENTTRHREITATLYGGDEDMRIRQEILLGVGGVRALRALDLNPAVTHMNEGHSAFLGLERIRTLIHDMGMSFSEAHQAIWPTNIFTTHTPVPAGNERFSVELVARYFKGFAEQLGLSWKEFLGLGRENADNDQESFCMTVLALKLAAHANGVSKLHGQTSRQMWRNLWPDLPIVEVPVISITNGVHPRTWISHNMIDLLDRYLGPQFQENPADFSVWEHMDRISDEELFRTHERRRERLVAFVRHRLRQQLQRRGFPEAEIQMAEDVLSPYTLTISFARRFATYKRANLLLQDPERLIRLLTDGERPIQLIFAGKAHPHDLKGKELIRELIHFAQDPQVRSQVVFLEDYDMTIARYLNSGSDVWLNTPRRPLEASGTSGMKAAMNGVLNLSILDGWWDEIYSPECGWAIGSGEEYEDSELQDEIESKAVYDLLEREIIPQFYIRGRDGLPRQWIKRMKASMAQVGKEMNSHRMLIEYSEKFYLPALEKARAFAADDYASARQLSAYLQRLKKFWAQVKVESLSAPAETMYKIGDNIEVSARINLGGLSSQEVRVELYFGSISSSGEIEKAHSLEMIPQSDGRSTVEYRVQVECGVTGRQGYTVRLLPKHPALAHHYVPGFLRWA
ncbi:MAG: alpha-glucan family phosphorylase [Spirochaetaceae bacterium]|nr:MAG: alpha-glucan family phosphorylase [Spirochaetaceae bacterium]